MPFLRSAALALPLAVIGTALVAAPAHASGGGRDVRAAGDCSASSDWKLKAGPDNGRLEVEFEVDSNVVGQSWTWRLLDQGSLVARGTSRTTAPSGSFEVHRRIADRAGADAVRFRAVNPASGETCTGTVTV